MLDASRLLHCRRCEVRSLPASPRCLAYAPGTAAAPESRLFIGDDVGTITTLTFRNPRRALLRPPDAENKSTSFFWPELRLQGAWVGVAQDIRVHEDAVSRLWYEAHNDSLVSCSRDPKRTVLVRHLARRREPYVFSLPRVRVRASVHAGASRGASQPCAHPEVTRAPLLGRRAPAALCWIVHCSCW